MGESQSTKAGRRTNATFSEFRFAESRYMLEPVDDLTPERLYDKQWVLTLLDLVLDRLQQEFTRAEKGKQFEQLKVFIYGDSAPNAYAQAACELDMSEGAARVAAHRLRQRFGGEGAFAWVLKANRTNSGQSSK